jgi:hypothetical protein
MKMIRHHAVSVHAKMIFVRSVSQKFNQFACIILVGKDGPPPLAAKCNKEPGATSILAGMESNILPAKQ